MKLYQSRPCVLIAIKDTFWCLERRVKHTFCITACLLHQFEVVLVKYFEKANYLFTSKN